MAHTSINGSQCEGYLHIKSDMELFKVMFCFCLDSNIIKIMSKQNQMLCYLLILKLRSLICRFTIICSLLEHY